MAQVGFGQNCNLEYAVGLMVRIVARKILEYLLGFDVSCNRFYIEAYYPTMNGA